MRIGCIIIGVVLAAAAEAQTLTGRDKWADSARVEIDAAMPAGDIARIRQAGAMLERALTVFPDDPLLLHYLGYARYREANLLQGEKLDEKEYRPLLEAADSLFERSATKLELPETYALRSSVLG
jgi:hypothetical protein